MFILGLKKRNFMIRKTPEEFYQTVVSYKYYVSFCFYFYEAFVKYFGFFGQWSFKKKCFWDSLTFSCCMKLQIYLMKLCTFAYWIQESWIILLGTYYWVGTTFNFHAFIHTLFLGLSIISIANTLDILVYTAWPRRLWLEMGTPLGW